MQNVHFCMGFLTAAAISTGTAAVFAEAYLA